MDDLVACLMDRIDERAALLERLLDDHPGRHLLAEYETTLLDRPGLAEPRLTADRSFEHEVVELLARVDDQIASLSPVAAY
jgi:hypothetical protein